MEMESGCESDEFVKSVAERANSVKRIRGKKKVSADKPPVIKSKRGKPKDVIVKQEHQQIEQLPVVEAIRVDQNKKRSLPDGLLSYYKKIINACICNDEHSRTAAWKSLSSALCLDPLLPQFITFITQGVHDCFWEKNFKRLVYLLRMLNSLVDNSSVNLGRYLDSILPSLISCIVTKQLGIVSDHWTLRDYASSIMARILKKFHNPINNAQIRVTKVYCTALTDDKMPLTTIYGAISGLIQLGDEAVRIFLLPRLRYISQRIESYMVETPQNLDEIIAKYIRKKLMECCPPILQRIRNTPDFLNVYENEYGFLGRALCLAVLKERKRRSEEDKKMMMID